MLNAKEVRSFVDMNCWVYERIGGDSGIVFAESLNDAIKELKKVYRDVDEQLKLFDKSFGTDGMVITDIGNYDNKGTVWVTFPS